MKRAICILLCICMNLTMLPTSVYAKDTTVAEEAQANEKGSTKNLEKSIVAVKSKINVPKKLSEFEYDYFTDYSNSYWQLLWHDEDYTEKISVNCDDKQNISSYYYYSEDISRKTKPTFLQSELKGKAEKFIKKIAPDIFDKIEYVETTSNLYNGQYTFSYRRVENGVPMKDTFVTVSINYGTGDVMSFNTNWIYDLDIPSKEVKITSQQAAKLIEKNLSMELMYQNYYEKDTKNNSKVRAYLVYRPDKSYISIDAKTSEVYTNRTEYEVLAKESKDEATADKGSGSATGLTEKEIESLLNLKGLITKTEAISTVRSEDALFLDKNLKSVTATLSSTDYNNNNGEKNYIWYLTFSDPSSKNELNNYANATVDAKTGKILSFYAIADNYNYSKETKLEKTKAKFDEKQCQKTFETFVKKQMPERFAKSQISENNNNEVIIAYVDGKQVYEGYSYQYDRVNEGVRYPYNGIYGTVDGITGKIYSFGVQWDDSVQFESPIGAITPKQAFDQYISKEGYGLVYEINTSYIYNKNTNEYMSKNEVRLVYRADIMPNTISPFTGEQLTGEGKMHNNKKSYSYTDIGPSKYQREIQLLADMGISFEGDKFLPNQNITKGELETLLSKINWNEEILSTVSKNQTITRVDAVKRFITFLGYENMAQLKNIYVVDFEDLENVDDSYIGYLALAKGMGIIDGNKLRPNENLTRSEAAYMIVNLLVAQSKY